MRILIGALIILSLTACATTGKYEKRLQSFVGRSEADIVQECGPPTRVFQLGDGTHVSSWDKYGSVESTVYGGGPMYGRSISSVQNYCSTHLTINKEGLVTYWRWEGNTCRSR